LLRPPRLVLEYRYQREFATAGSGAAPPRYAPLGGDPLPPLGVPPVPGRDWFPDPAGGATGPRREGLM